MNNLQANGWDFSDVKYVQLTAGEVETYRLSRGDILFNRTNSKELVGKCEVFGEPGEWVFASYLIRVRAGKPGLSPQFAVDFLNAPIGRLQIDQMSRQIIGMTNINAEEIKSIRIPLPTDGRQAELVEAMDAARAARKEKLQGADSLLAGLDDFLLETLGLTRPEQDKRRVFAVRTSDAQTTGRLNSNFFHPERILALRSMARAAGRLDCKPLHEVVEFVREQVKVPGANYLSLANVQSQTGELLDVREEVTGACSLFKTNDILFARLRPYLNKVYRAESDGCCSPEFHVIRVRDRDLLAPEYLAAILRSSLILAQTRHMMTGNTHPRLTNDDVVNLIIPIPTREVQETIAAEVRIRREEARRRRLNAEREWVSARKWFEQQLLRPPTH